jgi:hypothetical protein
MENIKQPVMTKIRLAMIEHNGAPIELIEFEKDHKVK